MWSTAFFGSKEQLFAEVVVEIMPSPTILASENLASSQLGASIAAALLEIARAGADPLEGFQVMLRSASSDRAAAIAREQIEKHYLRTMIAALPGELAAERAALIFTVVAGVQVMRQIVGLTALADADPEALVTLLAPVFQQLVDEPHDPGAPDS